MLNQTPNGIPVKFSNSSSTEWFDPKGARGIAIDILAADLANWASANLGVEVRVNGENLPERKADGTKIMLTSFNKIGRWTFDPEMWGLGCSYEARLVSLNTSNSENYANQAQTVNMIVRLLY